MNRTQAVAAAMKSLVLAVVAMALLAPIAACKHDDQRFLGLADAPEPDNPSAGGPTAFTVGGTVTGLAGSGLVLQDNATDDLPITANGSFLFPAKLAAGGAFEVTVKAQPLARKQTCVVSGSKGVVAKANITSVSVSCTTDTFSVGGSVSGLGAGQSVVLQINGANNLTVSTNGGFTFPAQIASGSTYAVMVVASPANMTCVVTNGSGSVAASNVTNTSVSCSVTACVPSCGGRVCGDDGCGGSCGFCAQTCTSNGMCIQTVFTASCTLEPPFTSSSWAFTQTYDTSYPSDAPQATTSTISWDTHGNSIPSTASSGPLTGNPATWTYSLTLLDGMLVMGSASVSRTGYTMTGTASNGATCTATLR